MLFFWLGAILLAILWLRAMLRHRGLRDFRPTARGLVIGGGIVLIVAMWFGRVGLFGPRFGWNGRAHDRPECQNGWLLPSLCQCGDNDGENQCCNTFEEQEHFNVSACE